MYLTYRPAGVQDLAPCLGMLPTGFECAPELLSAIPDLWCRWLRDGEMQMAVVEDEDQPATSRLVAFGASVFVTDDFLASLDTALPPPVFASIVAMAMRGRRVVLSVPQIRAENAGEGLNLLVLIIGWRPDIDDLDRLSRLKVKLLEAFYYCHAGYRIKNVRQEVYSDDELDRSLAVGAHLISDYSSVPGYDPPPPERRPYLAGGCRGNVREGSYLWPLFFYTPPKILFSASEQEVLKRALIDQTDSEIADALNVSLSSIHKRWQSIFDRAASTDVKWLPVLEPASAERHGRGIEKRRHLLSYMRAHPEELRPISAPKPRKDSD